MRQPKLLQHPCGQAGLVTLVTHEDDPTPRIAQLWSARLGARRASPLEHVARDEEGPLDHAIAGTLRFLAYVHQHSALSKSLRRVLGRDALKLAARVNQQLVDPHSSHFCPERCVRIRRIPPQSRIGQGRPAARAWRREMSMACRGPCDPRIGRSAAHRVAERSRRRTGAGGTFDQAAGMRGLPRRMLGPRSGAVARSVPRCYRNGLPVTDVGSFEVAGKAWYGGRASKATWLRASPERQRRSFRVGNRRCGSLARHRTGWRASSTAGAVTPRGLARCPLRRRI
jgi:hypothetical protein